VGRTYRFPVSLKIAIGAAAGFGYFILLMVLAVPLGGAGDGIFFPMALSSPFGLGGLITWPAVGALLVAGGRRACRATLSLLLVHYTCSAVYYALLPVSGELKYVADPTVLLFMAVFALGQALVWGVALRCA
jgi:hypothetical protein